MAQLREALEKAGYQNVSTYINSGNVLIETTETNTRDLARSIEAIIENAFHLPVGVRVISQIQYEKILAEAPAWWGKDPTWKHNFIVLIEPYDMNDVISTIGELKPDIEAMQSSDGVLYQSISLKGFGRSTGGKLSAKPVYKQMTIRNYTTAQKLLALLSK